MRKLLLLIATVALVPGLAACSSKTHDAVSDAAKSAESDAAGNVAMAGDKVEAAASDVGVAASKAADSTGKRLQKVGRETRDEAHEVASEARR